MGGRQGLPFGRL